MTLEEDHDSDIGENEEQYSNLLDAVSQLDNKRRVKAPSRKELSSVVSEFHMPKPTSQAGDIITVKELTQALKRKSAHQKLSEKVNSTITKAKILPKPLEKPVTERIKRAVGYSNVKTQLRKWNAVVTKNRASEHLSFPLQAGKIKMETSKEFFSKFKPKTPLEVEYSKILDKNEKEEMSDAENELNKNLEFPLTLEEMMEKKKELAQMRAKMSYQEIKAHRQSKIKSKKYHRILKREKIRKEFKDFEELMKTDPEAALKKLAQLDKSRAQERASLRHKNTGKWAKNLAVRAKYNKDSRKVLAEQLKLGRDLTEKVKNNIDSDNEGVSDNENGPQTSQDKIFLTSNDNPWALKVSSEVSDLVVNCKKFWEEKNKSAKSDSTSIDKAGKECPEEEVSKTTKQDTDSVNKEEGPNVGPNNLDGSCHENKKLEMTGETSDSKKKTAEITVKKLNSGNVLNAKENGINCLSKNEKKKKEKRKRRKTKKNPGKKCKLNGNASGTELAKVQSTSGSWSVTEQVRGDLKRKRPADIDDLFDDLDEKIASKASKKLKKLKRLKKKYEAKRKTTEKETVDSDSDVDLSMKKNEESLRPDMDVELAETSGHNTETPHVQKNIRTQFDIAENDKTPEIDPKVYIDVKPKKLNTKLPSEISGDFIDDAETAHEMNIVEAFGDDDVIEEFKEMKREEEESTKLEMPQELPGWGSWGGTDIKPSERKKKRYMVNMTKLPPRKDDKKKDIIIREKANQKAVDHMVKDVPHPFKSVAAFESSIRQPVGREWVPETAHRKFIRKPIETEMGVVIDPMDESELLRLSKDTKSLYRGKKREDKK